jgi:hypothetical protein
MEWAVFAVESVGALATSAAAIAAFLALPRRRLPPDPFSKKEGPDFGLTWPDQND